MIFCTTAKKGIEPKKKGTTSVLAMNYRGPLRVRIDHKSMPEILHPQDAIVRVTRSCICGSDLHLYNGSVPDTRVGMTFGHEFTGVVEQLGEDVQKLKVGDHVLVPFNIACGAGRPSERGGRRPGRPEARPRPQRLRRTGLKGGVGTQQVGSLQADSTQSANRFRPRRLLQTQRPRVVS